MLSSAGGRVSRPAPPVLVSIATAGDGVEPLREAIEAHRAGRTPEQVRTRAGDLLRRAVAARAYERAARSADWAAAVTAVAERREDPFSAADRLLG
jgi:putative protein kinase ArgK-like GTPase of G3E family